MLHIDLFSGIGGFALAVDEVWHDEPVEHVFCEIDPFCQAVLRKHWPNHEVYADIKTFANSDILGRKVTRLLQQGRSSYRGSDKGVDLLTGGFPCQPFSAAGKRRGTSDDRHLWPEMLRVIRSCKPQWVIAENVRGLLTLQGGLVFEQVCLDLEASGYAVQPFIIPAVAVNAPHRRDRVWFVANRTGDRRAGGRQGATDEEGHKARPFKARELAGGSERPHSDAANTSSQRQSRSRKLGRSSDPKEERSGEKHRAKHADQFQEDWLEVATRLCSVDDGLSAEVGNFTLTKAGHRKEQLKAYGNAIVPQVAMEILKAIKEVQGEQTSEN